MGLVQNPISSFWILPCSKLKAMEERVRGMELTGKAETTQTRRYASSQAAAQGNTQHSLPTPFLPTPAPHVDQRRIRDFTTTSHLEVSASNQMTSQQVCSEHRFSSII